jgi:hypothetical protein
VPYQLLSTALKVTTVLRAVRGKTSSHVRAQIKVLDSALTDHNPVMATIMRIFDSLTRILYNNSSMPMERRQIPCLLDTRTSTSKMQIRSP